MTKEKSERYSNFSNVESMNNELIPEEFPEGSFGSPIRSKNPVVGKSTPWKKGQKRKSAFIYPNQDLHAGLPRQTPGAHPLHDEASKNNEELE